MYMDGNFVQDALSFVWGPQGVLNLNADNVQSLNANVDAVYRALVARQTYVNSTHPNLLPRYSQLRTAGQSNWNWSQNVAKNPNAYTAAQIHQGYQEMLPWLQDARQFVDTCDAMYAKEQGGQTPAQAEGQVAANPPAIRGADAASPLDILSAFPNALKWGVIGVAALVLGPPLLNIISGAGNGRR